jgi:hypothetical protein
MTRDRKSEPMLTRILTSLVIGAAAMYALDPDRGRRRRAIARDKARSFVASTRDAVGVTRRDFAHRVQGLRARARRLFEPAAAPDDLQLIERVRARMGRLVSHPHAIQVGARDGSVTLSGPILAHEVASLLTAVRSVWGVADVVDRLVAYDTAEHISSLQGGDARGPRSALVQEYWPPALRAAALLGGALIALSGLQRRSLAGFALTTIGAGLAVRAIGNRSLNTLADRLLNDRETNVTGRETRDAQSARLNATARRDRGGPSIYDTPANEGAGRSPLH